MNLLVVVIGLIMLFSVALGAYKGLIRTLVALVSWIAILFLIGWINPYVSRFVIRQLTESGKTVNTVTVSALSYLIAVIIAVTVVTVVGKVLGLLGKLPGISILNRILGAVFGAVRGIVLIWLFFLIVVITEESKFGTFCLNQIHGSALLLFLYEHNPILAIVQQLL